MGVCSAKFFRRWVFGRGFGKMCTHTTLSSPEHKLACARRQLNGAKAGAEGIRPAALRPIAVQECGIFLLIRSHKCSILRLCEVLAENRFLVSWARQNSSLVESKIGHDRTRLEGKRGY